MLYSIKIVTVHTLTVSDKQLIIFATIAVGAICDRPVQQFSIEA